MPSARLLYLVKLLADEGLLIDVSAFFPLLVVEIGRFGTDVSPMILCGHQANPVIFKAELAMLHAWAIGTQHNVHIVLKQWH